MKLIVGLGNPGKEYSRTRHNMGRRLLEYIASKEKASFALKKSLKTSLTSIDWNGEEVYLAYPSTYMNLSGEALQALARHFHITSLQDILVVTDDKALPLGKLRLRSKGSSGGHKGLLSIEKHLKTTFYPRLRLGIGTLGTKSFTQDSLKDYVLSPFLKEEEEVLAELFPKGFEACILWVTRSLQIAMNRINSL